MAVPLASSPMVLCRTVEPRTASCALDALRCGDHTPCALRPCSHAPSAEAWQATVAVGYVVALRNSSLYPFPLGFQIDFQFKI
jgi:hypothetical protein